MANKQQNTPDSAGQPKPGMKPRALDGEETVNDDLDDDLPPYAAGEELSDEDDLLSDDDLNEDDREAYRGADKRKN